MPAALPPDPAPPAQRSDGAEARERLLHTALRLFSEQGFVRTSTRALAQAACVNLAAIRYYFGDKAGLYRATFTELAGGGCDAGFSEIERTDLPLPDMLLHYYTGFAEPLKQRELMHHCLRLHIREMLEPTEQSAMEREKDVRTHGALVAALCRHLALAQADDDVHRLAVALSGLGMQLFVAHEMVLDVRPALLSTPEAIDAWSARLVQDALALVAAEAERRALPPARRKKKA
ncbi:MAG: CerR family C-terminal domain-containing protein [Pseudomonadota bacterium]